MSGTFSDSAIGPRLARPAPPGVPAPVQAPVMWLGELSDPPANPQIGWEYRNTKTQAVYVWAGSGWVLGGAVGKDGAQGKQGLAGNAGAAGVAGKDGAPGGVGPAGVAGVAGAAGAAGAKGDKGDKGDTGTAGTPGAPGAAGATGPDGSSRAIVLCVGYTPPATGPDTAEYVIPYAIDGTTVLTWRVARITLRVQVAGGLPSVTFEKSSGSGGFAASTIGTVTTANNAYEASVTAALGTIASGDKIRLNFQALALAQGWTAILELGYP